MGIQMKYTSLQGSFGCFESKLPLGDGLNIVYAKNESGKSTVCALLKAVLYGVDTAERARSDRLPVKDKYRPWSGAPMSGRLELVKDGRAMFISRSTPRAKAMGAFDSGFLDGEGAPPFDGSNAGEVITGVTAGVFSKSLFCAAEDMAVTGSDELERRIASIASSGDEAVSAAQVRERLRAEMRARKYQSRGVIPEGEARISEIDRACAEIERHNARALELGIEADELEDELSRLGEIERDLASYRNAQKLARVLQARRAAEDAEAEVKRFETEHGLEGKRADSDYIRASLAAMRGAMGRDIDKRMAEAEAFNARVRAEQDVFGDKYAVFNGLTPEFATETARRDAAACAEKLTARAAKWPFLPAAASLAAAVVLALPSVLAGSQLLKFGLCAALFVLAAVFTGIGIAGIAAARRQKRGCERILSRYGAESPQQIMRLAAEYAELNKEEYARKAEAERSRAALVTAKEKAIFTQSAAERVIAELGLSQSEQEAAAELERISELLRSRDKLAEAAEKAKSVAAAVAEGENLKELEADAARVRDNPEVFKRLVNARESTLFVGREKRQAALSEARKQAALAEGAAITLGDIAALRAERAALADGVARAKAEFSALELADEVMAACAEDLSGRLAPKIGRRAEELFTRLTDGRYGSLTLDHAFNASVAEAGGISRSALNLSTGAYDLLYLAVRIALAEVMFSGELPPLVFDDAAAALDDARMSALYSLLAELGQTRQIICFTCRISDREAAKAAGANVIEL